MQRIVLFVVLVVFPFSQAIAQELDEKSENKKDFYLKKGKGFELRMSSYMKDKNTWEKLGKEMGAKLVDFQPGSINIGL